MADIDPSTMATSLATYYTQAAQSQIKTQTTKATNTSSALTKLKTALSTFDTALAGLSSVTKTVTQNSATFSSAVGTATAKSSATPGTYSFFVEQLAAAHQVAYQDLPAIDVINGGPLVVQLGDGSNFSVDLQAADTNGDGSLSQSEIARAINIADNNGGKVSATVVTVGSQTQLVLSAGATGAAGAISLDTSGLPDSALKTALSGGTELVAAKDAVVWLGAKDTGIRMQQASNTFNAVDGVSMTFTQAMEAGSAPVTLTVANDTSATTKNVQSFVDAYNALGKVLRDLTASGDAEAGVSAAVFASDSGVRALRSRLSGIVRDSYNGLRLADFGVSISRDGTMSLDSSKLETKLAADPSALDGLFGKATAGSRSGLIGAMDTYLDGWLNSTSGQIKRRQETVQKMQATLTSRQTVLDARYDSAYARYLAQFTQLQTLTSKMGETTSLLQSLMA